MGSVSRGVVEPSCFLVTVAESGESIEKNPRRPRRGCRAFLITVHQRRRRRKQAAGELQSEQIQRVGGRRGTGGASDIRLLTIVVITSIISLQLKTQEVGHDGYPQERRTRAREPRLAGFAFHVFVCRLFRSRACAVPHAAGDERRPSGGGGGVFPTIPPRPGKRHPFAGKGARAHRQR